MKDKNVLERLRRKKLGKKAQEEMIGFALIVVLVSVILLIFIGFSLRDEKGKENVESYEVESFIQAMLQYTTDCKDNQGYVDVQKLIFMCNSGENCVNAADLKELSRENSCSVLNSTLEEILNESWKVGDEWPAKGYEFEIIAGDEELVKIVKGSVSSSFKGASQDFFKGGKTFEIAFNVYY